MRQILLILISILILLSATRMPLIKEKCIVYKVSYAYGKKIDSVLFKKIEFDTHMQPVVEIVYSNDGVSIDYKKEFTYKNYRLTGIIIKNRNNKNEKELYEYNSLGLMSKAINSYDNKLKTSKTYFYEGNNLKSIIDYHYVNKKPILVSKEVRSYNEFNKIVKEAVINSKGDTTFKGMYLYENSGAQAYKGYGSDNKELESYRSFFINDTIITDKIFYREDVIIMRELYFYDSLQRLIKKELRAKDETILESDEYLYNYESQLAKIIKVNYREDRKEITEYEKSGRVKTEEIWQGNKIEVKLYYQYSILK